MGRMSAAGAPSTIPQEKGYMNVLSTRKQSLKSIWFQAPQTSSTDKPKMLLNPEKSWPNITAVQVETSLFMEFLADLHLTFLLLSLKDIFEIFWYNSCNEDMMRVYAMWTDILAKYEAHKNSYKNVFFTVLACGHWQKLLKWFHVSNIKLNYLGF